MTQVKAYVPGLYARAGGLEETRSFLTVQRDAGMDYFSDGLLGWPELTTPLANRSGAVVGATEQDWEKVYEPPGQAYFRVPEMPRGRWFPTLPSPLALSRGTGLSERHSTEDVLSPQIGWLAGNGCAFVVLQETRIPDTKQLAALEESIEALHSPLPLVLRLPPGDAAEAIPAVAEFAVEAVGVDMIATDIAALPEPFPRTLLAGVVDAADPDPEKPSRVAARYEELLQRLGKESDLHLAPNGDLRALTPEQAARKVRGLGDAARILRGG